MFTSQVDNVVNNVVGLITTCNVVSQYLNAHFHLRKDPIHTGCYCLNCSKFGHFSYSISIHLRKLRKY